MTLSDDGQWMWDGNQWIPAPPAAAPAPAPAPPQSQYGRFHQPSVTADIDTWSPQGSSVRSSKMPVAVIVTIVILVIGGATGGILWATGVFSSDEGDELVGTWLLDDEDAIEFKSNGDVVMWECEDAELCVVSSDMIRYSTYSWTVNGDTLTVIGVQHIPTGTYFECNDGREIPTSYINDGDEDCDGGEDEGVDTSNIPSERRSTIEEFRYAVNGDYLYLGMTKYTVTEYGEDGDLSGTNSDIVSGDICGEDTDGICLVLWHTSVNPSETMMQMNAPDWFEPTSWLLAPDQPESGTRNSYTADDAAASATDSDDDVLISMRWQHAEDHLNWAFVVMKLSVGDNTFDCAPDASQECMIGQDGDDNSLWETDEFLILSESGTNICGSSGACQIDIYITYRGVVVAGDDSVVVS